MSIGSRMPAKSPELQHTIWFIQELDAEIHEIEVEIETMMDEIQPPITTNPGIGCRMGAMILAEAGDLLRFDSPDKLLAYAGMSPSNLPVRAAEKLSPTHGETGLQISVLRTFQRYQV